MATFFKHSLEAPHADLYNITRQIAQDVAESGVISGIVVVYCPHTTAGITLNANADPDVVHDLLLGLDAAYPDLRQFRHSEGNSTGHLKSSGIGASETLLIENGSLVLGTWQGIYFCEFDPPRHRTFYVKIIEGS